jgi:hypothetical protein
LVHCMAKRSAAVWIKAGGIRRLSERVLFLWNVRLPTPRLLQRVPQDVTVPKVGNGWCFCAFSLSQHSRPIGEKEIEPRIGPLVRSINKDRIVTRGSFSLQVQLVLTGKSLRSFLVQCCCSITIRCPLVRMSVEHVFLFGVNALPCRSCPHVTLVTYRGNYSAVFGCDLNPVSRAAYEPAALSKFYPCHQLQAVRQA